jgi:hypothetical protein
VAGHSSIELEAEHIIAMPLAMRNPGAGLPSISMGWEESVMHLCSESSKSSPFAEVKVVLHE